MLNVYSVWHVSIRSDKFSKFVRPNVWHAEKVSTSLEIALKYTKMAKSKKTSKTRQKFDFGKNKQHFFPHVSRSLLCIRFVAVAFRTEEELSWRGPIFAPALDPPLDGSGRKTTTLLRDLEYFIHTKIHQNPSSGSGEEVENVNSLTDDGRTDGRRTTHDHNRSLEPLAPVP